MLRWMPQVLKRILHRQTEKCVRKTNENSFKSPIFTIWTNQMQRKKTLINTKFLNSKVCFGDPRSYWNTPKTTTLKNKKITTLTINNLKDYNHNIKQSKDYNSDIKKSKDYNSDIRKLTFIRGPAGERGNMLPI